MKFFHAVLHFYQKHNTLFRNLLILVILSLITSHLTDYDTFSTGDSYDFPWFSIITSIIIGSLIGFIAEKNFTYHKKHYFSNEVSSKSITVFVFTTLGIISLVYIPLYYIAVWFVNASYSFYFLLIGLLITLLLSTIAIALLYGHKIYRLHKLEVLDSKLSVTRNGKTLIVPYHEIAYFYSEEKVVYLVKSNGESFATEFTLQQLETILIQGLFFRANRQFIVSAKAINEMTSIANGKLLVTLIPIIAVENKSQLVISRYKKQEFLAWFENKLVS
ncbi:LytR/AlgR family response regulator transcription factor [Tenacibaculum amylolyticum]|uniref:LytR/AlgR family response regulator transcription factor n=1 Tax=Tenacibaculum amylolyticum TaxID=104269 RepID=UPI00389678BE